MRGQAHEIRWMEAKNTGSVEVPSFGVVQITGATWENPGRTVLLVSQPTTASASPIAANSWKPIPAGDYGLVTIDGPAFCLYSGTYSAAGTACGSQANSFQAADGATGMISLGAVDTTKGLLLVNFSFAGGGRNSVATTEIVIPARSGTTPGGPVKVQPKKLDDLTTPTFIDDGAEVDVYSWIKSASTSPALEVDGLLWIFIEQDAYGVWWFTGQDCPPAG